VIGAAAAGLAGFALTWAGARLAEGLAARSAGAVVRPTRRPPAEALVVGGAWAFLALRAAAGAAVSVLPQAVALAAAGAASTGDRRHRRIANAVTAAAAVAVALASVLRGPAGWGVAATGGLAGAAIGLALAAAPGGLGMGDAKMLAVLGLALGARATVVVLAGAAFLATAWGSGRVLVGRAGWRDRFAFAPFLLAATVAVVVVGVSVAGGARLSV